MSPFKLPNSDESDPDRGRERAECEVGRVGRVVGAGLEGDIDPAPAAEPDLAII